MKKNLVIFCVSILTILAASNASAHRRLEDTSRKENLSKKTATKRSQVVSNAAYNLYFELDAKSADFIGKNTASFDLSKTTDISLDFNGGTVKSLVINGKTVDHTKNYNKQFINLKKKHLKIGPNQVVVEFTHPYSKTGSGFYKFTDPADKRVYTYTDFEPFHANELFPSFDQPDIKATYELAVLAPKTWTVVTSVRESKKSMAGKRRLWNFPKSKRFSTYIFSLHAGEYHIWENNKGDVPLRLMARQSMKKHVDHKFWFKITSNGFKYFNKYFDYKYPFEKYDQIVVPDFSWGAMENVGAVTFSEKFAPRSAATRKQRQDLADTILHEMAHMWFGNLVTMKWWNDLWLNESFATYMATLALYEATEFDESWRAFYQDIKQWAYWEDDMVTRHPITTAVSDTNQAFANFDGITYGKGASSLKQLAFLIGPQNFQKGLRLYFKTHAYKNTVLSDFISALSKASGQDLQKFTAEWLETSGTNVITANYQCEDDKITQFSLLQSAPADATTLRTHRTRVAMYKHAGPNQLKLIKQSDIVYKGEKTNVPEFAGLTCPGYVNVNKDDYDFAKAKLDERSLATVRRNFDAIKSDLDRMMVWQSLWNMVRDGDLDVMNFQTLAQEHLNDEKNVNISRQIIHKIAGRRGHSAKHYFPSGPKIAKAARDKFTNEWEAYTWRQLIVAKGGSDEQLLWLDNFIKIAATKDAQLKLKKLLTGKIKLKTYKMDAVRRWSIINQLSAHGDVDSEKLILKALKKDKSADAKKKALAARTRFPSFEVKQKYWNILISKDDKVTLADRRTITKSLFPEHQENFHLKFVDKFYNTLPNFVKTHDQHLVEVFVSKMTPAFCDNASLGNLRKFIKTNKNLPPYAIKPLRIQVQENEICIKARAVAMKTLEKQSI